MLKKPSFRLRPEWSRRCFCENGVFAGGISEMPGEKIVGVEAGAGEVMGTGALKMPSA
ncbi:MAG: hypothetical protein ACE5FU_01875 [Nitrospinota bacterium]